MALYDQKAMNCNKLGEFWEYTHACHKEARQAVSFIIDIVKDLSAQKSCTPVIPHCPNFAKWTKQLSDSFTKMNKVVEALIAMDTIMSDFGYVCNYSYKDEGVPYRDKMNYGTIDPGTIHRWRLVAEQDIIRMNASIKYIESMNAKCCNTTGGPGPGGMSKNSF
jgi:hypothetical protein